MIVIKKIQPVQAFTLGQSCAAAERLLKAGILLPLNNGQWRIKTQEAPTEGELAKTGDYIKLDSAGFPYPTEKAWFEANHTPLYENFYLQAPAPKKAWCAKEPICPEIRFLLDSGELIQSVQTPDKAFRANLWGTEQTAGHDAVIIFDRLAYDASGNPIGADFHFITRQAFQKAYTIL